MRSEPGQRRLVLRARGSMRCTLSVLLVTGISICSLAQVQLPDNDLQSRLQAHSAAVSSRDISRIETTSKQLCSLSLRLLAGLRVQQDKYNEAAKLYEQSLAFEDNLSTTRELAFADLLAGRNGEAEKLAEQFAARAPEDPAAWSFLGQTQSAKGDYSAAARAFARAFQLRPDLNTVYMLGVAYLRSQQKDRAAVLFQDAIKQFGEGAALHIGFGIAYQDSNLLDQAIDEFEQALELDANVPNGHFLLGNAFLAKNAGAYNPDSLREFTAALQQNPSDYRTSLSLGIMDSEFGAYEQAEKYLRAALSNSPDSVAPVLQLGFNAFEQEDYTNAKRLLEEAVQSGNRTSADPRQLARAYIVLSNIAEQQHDDTTAKSMFALGRELSDRFASRSSSDAAAMSGPHGSVSAASREPAEPKPAAKAMNPEQRQEAAALEQQYREILGTSLNDWGTAEAQSGNFANALQKFQEAERWNPKTAGLMENLGLAAYKLGDYKEAARALRLAQPSNHSSDITGLLAASLLAEHQYAEAASTFAELGPAIYSDSGMTYQYSLALTHSHQEQAALQALAHLHPEFFGAEDSLAIGQLYVELNDFEPGIAYFKRALEQDPTIAGAYYGLGLALSHLDRSQEAVNDFKEELRLHPESPEAVSIHTQLARLYQLLGEKTDAQREEQLSKPAPQSPRY